MTIVLYYLGEFNFATQFHDRFRIANEKVVYL